ncbi:MAG: hypothetical protein AAF541_09230 [Pseudomonadota bacterium]
MTFRLVRLALVGICLCCAYPVPGDTRPNIMVLLDERISGVYGTTATETFGHAENVIANTLRDAGFRVLDPATVRANIKRTKGLRLMEGDERAAVAVGLQNEASYSVLGTALSKPSAVQLYQTRMQSLQGTVAIRVVRNDDAQTIASASASATQAHIDEVAGGAQALEKAATQAAFELSQTLGQLLSNTHDGDQALQINISGLASYRHLDFVMNYLDKELNGVTQVRLSSFTEGVAVLDAQYGNTIESIAGQIARKNFTGFRLEPTQVSSHRLDLAAVLDQP